MSNQLDNLRVSDLDESDLLALIFPHLPTNNDVLLGPGDDCAVVTAEQGSFAVSTDILIENVHFRTDWSTAYQVGWRAAMQNLADVAAMGVRPSSLVVGLAFPKTTLVSWVVEFARGLGDAARSVGAACVGGDLSSAPSIFISVTVHGAPQHEPVTRAGAQPGNVVAIAGHVGWSKAGLDLMTAGLVQPQNRSQALAVQTFLAPTAPVLLGEVAAAHGATAMMDVSDGLLRDGARLCKASGVHIDLDFQAIKDTLATPELNSQLSAYQSGVGEAVSLERIAAMLAPADSLEQAQLVAKWLLSGGEDHGLLATFPGARDVPQGFAVVGVVRPQDEPMGKAQQPATRVGAVRVVGVDLQDVSLGWDHFR